jgi:DNA (cytosine-5)-methyltransferase 1
MHEEKEIRYIDLFGGVGGFRLGLERAEGNKDWRTQPREERQNQSNDVCSEGDASTFHCVWYNDIDKWATQIYNKRFDETYEPRDIREIHESAIPAHDLICSGFPCQSFSIAGKRRGLQDTRGTLFFEICRIAKYHRPKYLLLENVKGLLSSDCGRTFTTILESLWELGYDVEWQVLNSKNFGVPQSRERVFIIGHLGGFGESQVFPLGENDKVPAGTPKGPEGKGPHVRTAHTLTRGYYRDGSEILIAPFIQTRARGRNPGWRKELPHAGTHKTMQHNEFLVDTTGIRRLTPIECERLQGFPDGWTEGISDTQRYKLMGNAVTVNVVEAIGRKMQEVLQ